MINIHVPHFVSTNKVWEKSVLVVWFSRYMSSNCGLLATINHVSSYTLFILSALQLF